MGGYVWTRTVIGTPKIIASTGVFMRVVCALKRFFSKPPLSIKHDLYLINHKQSRSHHKICPERDFYEGRQRTKQTERQPRIVADLKKLNT
jgi:hypothetical protein